MMHGLRTSSVLILDDDDKDALRIQKSLAMRGIGAILVPGAPDQQQPDGSLKGIRVAVLDIDLGFGTDDLSKVRHTRDFVNRLIDKENGPYVAVVWTSNPETFELFQSELQTIECPPVQMVTLEKALIFDLAKEERAEAILSAIGCTLAKAPPLEFANLWEQIIRDSANDTIVSLEVAGQSGSPGQRALDFFAALLNSEADARALEDDDRGMRALLAALNPVHFDKVEERSAGMSQEEAAVIAPIRDRACGATGDLCLIDLAKLNSSLLFDHRVEDFGPGRLYRFDDIRQLEIGSALPDEQCIRTDTMEHDHLQRRRDLPILLLEVSAACDHQQEKIRTARLLAGVVFDASTFKRGIKAERVHARGGDYLREVAPLHILGIEGFPADEVRIVWNAHFPVSISVSEISNTMPIGRFREPLVADVRAWLGYQASRPGYAAVREK